MGFIRDAAVEAVRELIKDSVIAGGLGAIVGALDFAEGVGEKLSNRKVKAAEKKAEKTEKKIEKEAKKEEFISKLKNPSTLLKKYKNSMVAFCSDKEGSRTYVFMMPDNQIKYMTNGSINESGIGLYNYDEELIGSIMFSESGKSESDLKKFSKEIKLNIGDSQIGTVEIVVTDVTKTIKLNSYFWSVWMKSGDSTVEKEDEFRMSPLISLSKRAYQISYNDTAKQAVLALTYVGLNEARQILRDNKF